MRTTNGNRDPEPADSVNDRRFSLILYNDDYHTYDYVIDTLVKVCGLDKIQATQCTFLIHFKEKCEVKRGPKTLLVPMQKELIKRDLKAVIN